MSIKFKPNTSLSENDKYTIKWLNKHGVNGYFAYKRKGISTYFLRKPGMLSFFVCKINYDEVKTSSYLEHLEKALTERAEQEERAKQCCILMTRIIKLHWRKMYPQFIKLYFLDDCKNDHILSEEEIKLLDECHRLYPQEATTYEEKNMRYYPRHFHYWNNYIRNINYRFMPCEYIPVYNNTDE